MTKRVDQLEMQGALNKLFQGLDALDGVLAAIAAPRSQITDSVTELRNQAAGPVVEVKMRIRIHESALATKKRIDIDNAFRRARRAAKVRQVVERGGDVEDIVTAAYDDPRLAARALRRLAGTNDRSTGDRASNGRLERTTRGSRLAHECVRQGVKLR